MLAGIINVTTPLATLVVILAAFREERTTRVRTFGLPIGFVGLAVVLGIWRGFAGSELVGVLACLEAVACYGVAFPCSRCSRGAGPDPSVLERVRRHPEEVGELDHLGQRQRLQRAAVSGSVTAWRTSQGSCPRG